MTGVLRRDGALQEGRVESGEVGSRATPTAGNLAQTVERTERTVQAFLQFLGDRLSAPRRRVFERLLANQASLRGRQIARPHTVVHGDAHWWNFLYPRESNGDGGGDCND